MKCYCCDVILTPQEATRKFKESGEYVDMCNKCFTTIEEDVEYVEGNGEDEEFDKTPLGE